MVTTYVALAVVSLLIVVASILYGAYVDDTRFLVVAIVATIAMTAFFIFAVNEEQQRADAPEAYCINQGYTEAYEKSEAWYCLSFGSEPRIALVKDNSE